MNYTENYRGIKIDVQSVHLDIGEPVQQEIRAGIDKLSRFTNDINGVDLYFKTEGHSSSSVNIVGVRVFIPGPDVFAESQGEDWIPILKDVIGKLSKQLKKK
jgi:putative sigma-54 modulation protein